MSVFDLKCEADEQADGSWTLTLTVKGLTVEQAHEISDGLRDPVRAVVVAAVNIPAVFRDLSKPTQ